jgi:hypothetical protein
MTNLPNQPVPINVSTKVDSIENNFDCVAFMRSIRDKMSADIEHMTLIEEIKYLDAGILNNADSTK